MTENEVFASVQAFRSLVQDKYQWALGANRYDWLAPPTDAEQSFIVRMNIGLGQVVGSGKRGRLEACEVLSTLFGWNPGTTADDLWEVYARLKKHLGRGNADRAFEEIRKDAKRIWGLGSTKDLYLAELSALIDWLEKGHGITALQAVARAPGAWVGRLERLAPVKRPSNFVPPPAPVEDEPPAMVPDSDPAQLPAEPVLVMPPATYSVDDDFYREIGL